MNEEMTHTEIVNKLIGSIKPYGSTDIDEKRMENLKAMCELIEDLVFDVRQVATYRIRHEHSMKEMGLYAEKFLTETLGIVE